MSNTPSPLVGSEAPKITITSEMGTSHFWALSMLSSRRQSKENSRWKKNESVNAWELKAYVWIRTHYLYCKRSVDATAIIQGEELGFQFGAPVSGQPLIHSVIQGKCPIGGILDEEFPMHGRDQSLFFSLGMNTRPCLLPTEQEGFFFLQLINRDSEISLDSPSTIPSVVQGLHNFTCCTTGEVLVLLPPWNDPQNITFFIQTSVTVCLSWEVTPLELQAQHIIIVSHLPERKCSTPKHYVFGTRIQMYS